MNDGTPRRGVGQRRKVGLTKMVSLKVGPKLYGRLEQHAVDTEESVPTIVRRAVAEYLDKNEGSAT